MNAQPIITSGTGLYKAVCHKCHYVGFEPCSSTCPHCSFPIILEPYEKTTREALREIFDRNSAHVSVNHNAPLLPGVTNDNRKAQVERKRRRTAPLSRPVTVAPKPVAVAEPVEPVAVAVVEPVAVAVTEPVAEPAPRRVRFRRLRAALAFMSAITVGVVAAVAHNGF